MVSVDNLNIVAWIILAAVLALAEWGYIRIARRPCIGITGTDSHGRRHFTAVGGGFIFILAAVIAMAFYPATDRNMINIYMYTGGAALLAVMSYADDLVGLSALLRLVAHIVVIALVLAMYPFGGNNWLYLIAVTACTGYVNASNFMDGSNGMLALYSAVVLASLLFVEVTALGIALLTAVAVFAFFNCRKNAKVYSGDVGSISIGFFIATTITYYILVSGEMSMAVFVAVFLIDTFCTFIIRLANGERVLISHRKHLYQRLIAHGCRPVAVAAAYAGLQLAVNAAWLAMPSHSRTPFALAVAALLLAAYTALRFALTRKTEL